MKDRFSLLLSFTFFSLSIIHFNWAMGNKWGLSNALPTDANGNAVLQPTIIDTLIVGTGLLFFALFYFSQTKYSFIHPPRWINPTLRWFIPIIFLLRSIGDFKYVGFFKEITETEFASMDSLFYSPLCLVIAIAGFLIIKKQKG